MFLSKLARYATQGTGNNWMNHRLLVTFTLRNVQNNQLSKSGFHNVNQNKVRILSQTLFIKPIRGGFYRFFNTEHNPYNNSKKRFGADTLNLIAILIPFAFLSYLTFDLKNIWNNYLPKIFKFPFEFVFCGFRDISRYIGNRFFKDADALAANPSKNEAEDSNLENLITK